MTLRICLVTPFAWSQPHDVNEHAAGIAKELRALGHTVTILAPSGRTADLVAGRRALARGENADVIAIGAAVQISRRSSLGVPVGVRANVRLALQNGRFDIVHGFEPGLPSISYVALRDSEALGVATFFSPERLGFPPRRALREKLLARIDALLATSEQTAAAAADRFPGDYRVISRGVDTELFRPAAKRKLVVIELHSGSLPVARAALRSLRELPGWEALLLRTKPLSTRPAIPLALRDRVARPLRPHGRRSGGRPRRGGDRRAGSHGLGTAAARGGRRRRRARRSAGRPGPARARRGGGREARRGRGSARTPRTRGASRRRGAELRRRRARARRDLPRARAAAAASAAAKPTRSPTGPGSSPISTCTPRGRTTARSRSPTCSTTQRPRVSARSRSPTTTRSAARSKPSSWRATRDLLVIPGEEVKTDDQGEVIGLFLHEEIPRGMTFAETVAAIREQEGVVYLPHPFDRMHAIPFPATLHRHLHEIDVLEVYNARLLFEGYNDEATALRAQVRAPGRRGLRRARPPGSRHGRAADARLRGPGGVHALAAHRRGPAPAEVARVPAEPQMGGASQGESPLGENRDTSSVSASPTDEIYDRYLKKAISEINELGDEVGRSGDEKHVPVLGSGHPLADVFLLKYEPTAVRGARGRRVLRPRRPGAAQVAAAAARRPDGRVRDELPQARRPGAGRGAAVARRASCTSSSRSCSS